MPVWESLLSMCVRDGEAEQVSMFFTICSLRNNNFPAILFAGGRGFDGMLEIFNLRVSRNSPTSGRRKGLFLGSLV